MDGLLTAAPALFLAAGATMSAMPSARLGRWRHFVPAAFALGGLLAALLAAWLTLPGRGVAALRLVLSPWSGSLAPGVDPIFLLSPGLDVDFLAALGLVVIAGLGLVVAVRAIGEADGEARRALAVAAASALFVAGTRNPLGLVLGWLVLDIVLVWLGAGRNSLVVGQIGLLLAIAGLAATGFEGERLGSAILPGSARLALVLAAMVRAGAYPLWWAIPRTAPTDPWEAIGLRLAPTVAGLGLALRVSQTIAPIGGIDYALFGPGLVAFGFAALLSFYARHRAACLDWRVASHVGLVLMALGLGDPVGRSIALILVLDLAATFAARYAAEGLGAGPLARAARAVADFGTMGLPPTLGFAGRWLLFNEVLLRFSPNVMRFHDRNGLELLGDPVLVRQVALQFGVGLVLLVAAALASAPMRGDWFPPPALPRGVRRTGAIVLGVALGGIGLGIALESLAPGFKALTGAALPSPLRSAARSSFAPSFLILFAPPLGWWLRRITRGPEHDTGALLWRGLRLVGILDAAGSALVRTGAAVQLRSGLVEGRRSMALTAVGAVATGAAIFARIDPGAGAAPVPGLSTIVAVSAAAACGALVVIARPAAAMLAGVLLAHFTAGAVLLQSGVPPVIVLVKVLVGLLVVGMLALSVLQAPIDRRLIQAARRLRAIGDAGPSNRLHSVAGIALVIFSIGALGLTGGAIRGGPEIPPMLLQTAVVLVIGGLLATMFADSVLELACGVLLALIGCEVAYANYDAGLVVTGALAVFQMLFAITASYFLGLAATSPAGDGALGADRDALAEARSALPEIPS